jgi:hypothetical protein
MSGIVAEAAENPAMAWGNLQVGVRKLRYSFSAQLSVRAYLPYFSGVVGAGRCTPQILAFIRPLSYKLYGRRMYECSGY